MKKDTYKLTPFFYIGEATFEYFISLLITSTFLAKLTTHLGFSDSLTAILSSFVALGCSFQLFSIAFFKTGRVKKRVTLMHIINQLLFMGIYLVPFTPFQSMGAKTFLFIVFLLGGYFISNVIHAPKINWFMSIVDDNKRGIFTSVKEMVSLIGGFAFNIIMGTIIDNYEAAGNIRGAFTICAATIIILMLLHTLTLVLSKEKEPKQVSKDTTVAKRFEAIIKDKNIMKVIFVSIFWTISTHVCTPFFGTYQVKELGFSMQYVAALSILSSLTRIPCSFILGRYADKTSFARMLKICFALAGVAFLFAAFTVPANGKVFYAIYTMLYGAAMGGINSAQINLIFDYVNPYQRSDALAIKQTIYGICGFVATLVFTPLFNYIQGTGNNIFGMHIYPQQLLSAVAFVLTILLIIYIDKIILRIKTQKDE